MKMINLLICAMIMVMFSVSVSAINLNDQPSIPLTSSVDLTFEDNQFKIQGYGQTIFLSPIVNYKNKWYGARNLPNSIVTPTGSDYGSYYKFGLNISLPPNTLPFINEVRFNILNGTDITYSDTGFYFGDEESSGAIYVDFGDIVQGEFVLSTGDGYISITNITNKNLNLDPTITFATVEITSIHTATLDTDKYIVVYCDDVNNDISFKIYNTTGSLLYGEKDIDTSAGSCNYQSVGASAVNTTHWVATWDDIGDGDASFMFFRLGTNKTGIIDADTNAGSSQATSVSSFNSTHFVISWFDYIDNDIWFSIQNTTKVGVNAGRVTVDNSVGTSYSVSVSAFNDTTFVIAYFDGADSDITFAVYNTQKTLIAGPIDVDENATDSFSLNPSYSTSVAALNSSTFVIGWYDAGSSDATFALYDSTGTPKSAQIDADTAADTSQSVQVAALNSTAFVITWKNSSTLNYATYTQSGARISAGTIDTSDISTSSYQYQSPTSYNTNGVSLCDDNWVIGYTNYTYSGATYKGILREYTPEGSAWNGVCPIESPTDSCTYSGSGVWTIQVSDNCVLSDNLINDSIIVNGTGGLLTINGNVLCKNSLSYKPTAFTGAFNVWVKSGKTFGVVK